MEVLQIGLVISQIIVAIAAALTIAMVVTLEATLNMVGWLLVALGILILIGPPLRRYGEHRWSGIGMAGLIVQVAACIGTGVWVAALFISCSAVAKELSHRVVGAGKVYSFFLIVRWAYVGLLVLEVVNFVMLFFLKRWAKKEQFEVGLAIRRMDMNADRARAKNTSVQRDARVIDAQPKMEGKTGEISSLPGSRV